MHGEVVDEATRTTEHAINTFASNFDTESSHGKH
jgi:hypothetical protein